MEDYLKVAKEIVKGAEDIALKYFGPDIESTWKEDNTPLTKADTEINSYVIDEIHKAYPDHSVFGEEESNIKEGSEYIWVCDPIDGTMAYSAGLPIFTFSLALVEQKTGLPILGIVSEPVMKNIYWATKGGGAYRNGKQIHVSPAKKLALTKVNVDGQALGKLFDVSEVIKNFENKQVKAFKLISFVYGAMKVAGGQFSGAVFSMSYPQDAAAVKIIVEEAGGKVTDLNGKERRYDQDSNGLVVSNGILHEEMLVCVK